MWLVHETGLYTLKRILQEGEIKPSGKNNEIYMSVLFDDVQIVGKGEADDVLIIFPIDTLEKYNPLHWSPDWFGEYKKGVSVKYDKSKSAKENVDIWNSIYHSTNTKVQDYIYKFKSHNEVVFNKSIPISEVAYIYVRKSVNPKFEIPNRVDTKQKLNKLIYRPS